MKGWQERSEVGVLLGRPAADSRALALVDPTERLGPLSLLVLCAQRKEAQDEGGGRWALRSSHQEAQHDGPSPVGQR